MTEHQARNDHTGAPAAGAFAAEWRVSHCHLCGRHLVTSEAKRRGEALFHDSCLAEVERQELEDKAVSEARVGAEVERERAALPQMPWARFDNEEFRHRASARIVTALERWTAERGSLILAAPTGRGKTAALVAWAARVHGSGQPAGVDFVSALELAGARRRVRLGGEAELVERANRARVLLLDEMGFEPLAEEPFLVIDARYRAKRPTVCTTGLRPAAFRERYGDALWRRLAEGGAVVADFPEGAT